MQKANPILSRVRSHASALSLPVCLLSALLLAATPAALAQATTQPSATPASGKTPATSAPAHSPGTQPITQSVAPRTQAHPAGQNQARRHRATSHRRKTQKPAPQPVAVTQPVIPPPPPPPDWPALQAAAPAQIHWDGKQLAVTANNSSLQQVIASISTLTHVPVTGLQSDQRLFGAYGPGTPQQVLTELLEGSGYDLLMIDGKVPGIPQRIELSKRGDVSAPSGRPSYNPPPPSSQPFNPALAQQQLNPSAPPRNIAQPPPGMTPQQLIEQRMQAIRQQSAPPPQ